MQEKNHMELMIDKSMLDRRKLDRWLGSKHAISLLLKKCDFLGIS